MAEQFHSFGGHVPVYEFPLSESEDYGIVFDLQGICLQLLFRVILQWLILIYHLVGGTNRSSRQVSKAYFVSLPRSVLSNQ